MISDEVKLYTKIVEVDDTYNFVVDNFHLKSFNSPKSYYKFFNFKV
jgi:hypothetical protein